MIVSPQLHNTAVSHFANTLAVTSTVLVWTGVLPIILSMVATVFTIVWMGIQITISVSDYLDRRQLARGPRGLPGPAGKTGPTGANGKIDIAVIKPITGM